MAEDDEGDPALRALELIADKTEVLRYMATAEFAKETITGTVLAPTNEPKRGTGKRGSDGVVPEGLLKRVKLERADAEDRVLCVVCTTAQRDALILPCNHLVCCAGCIARLAAPATCPICRARVEQTVPVSM